MAALVTLQHVGKSFGPTPALTQISIEAAAGDFIALIGPSGCGKSTLLRLIAGLTEPSEGQIRIGGKAPADARTGMGFVFQDPCLLPWRPALANVELPLQLRGEPAEARRASARRMLERVGLAGAEHKYPWQLSGGMRMRVSVARALSAEPTLLLLDEPFGALDEMTRDKLNEDLLALRERSPFTAFFVTHSVAEAVFLSTRVVVMSAAPGRIADTIPVPFPYPRRRDLRESEEYLALLARTSKALRSVNARHDAAA